jgi:hypothetical protein
VKDSPLKIEGKKIEGPNVEMIVIPRGEDSIVFMAQAVLDSSELDAILIVPVPPRVMKRGEGSAPDFTDTKYVKAMDEYKDARLNWLILKSLSATKGLEWETVDMSDPKTWSLYETELKTAGFTNFEINRIIAGVFSANGLDENKIEQARKRFLAFQADQKAEQFSQKDEQSNTPSGTPASA